LIWLSDRLIVFLYILIPLTSVSRERNSIAVRPLRNIGGQAEDEDPRRHQFEITTQLSQIENGR
jgi:hypothetical protein